MGVQRYEEIPQLELDLAHCEFRGQLSTEEGIRAAVKYLDKKGHATLKYYRFRQWTHSGGLT